MKKLHISWREMSCLAYGIADRADARAPTTHIAALSRGGLAMGVMLSHHWNVPLIPIVWSTRDHEQQRTEDAVRVLETLGESPLHRVLLVDDIADTGRSLSGLTDFLYNHQVGDARQRITTACLFQKTHSVFVPDLVGELVEQDLWVVFPFEEPLATQ